jgi:outer membrane lipoprotein SlyB
MIDLLAGLLGATAGAFAGEAIRRQLVSMTYRRDDEQDRATPGARAWVTAVAVSSSWRR